MRCSKQDTFRWFWALLLLAMLGAAITTPVSHAAEPLVADVTGSVVTNAMCPVTTDEPIDPDQRVMHEGKRVYFCCRTCKRKFERNPTAYLANLPQFASTSVKLDEAHEGHVHEMDSTSNTAEVADESDRAHESADDQSDHHHGAADDAAPPMVDDHIKHVTSEDHDEMEAAHDHAAHERGSSQGGLTRLIAWLGNFHPAAVNFPIALLITGAIAEMLMIATGRTLFSNAARFSVWLGSVSAVGGVILGWFFAGFRLSDPDWIMTVHRWLGTATGVWALLVLALCIAAYRSDDARRRWLAWYRIALFIGAAAVGANAFFGGALVYGIGHYAW